MTLRWQNTVRGKDVAFAFASDNKRYAIERFDDNRQLYVTLNGRAICETPTYDAGKILAQRHANGEWK